jgi:hypothetical protein
MKINDFLNEGWSQKYKSSINCSHPKGFSQKAHCAGKKKHNESVEMEMVCEDCGMCKSHSSLNEIAKGAKDSNGYTRCWPGKHAEGTKKGKNGGQVRNCVPNESVDEDLNRRGFLKGLGAAAVAGAAGGAKAAQPGSAADVYVSTNITDKIKSIITDKLKKHPIDLTKLQSDVILAVHLKVSADGKILNRNITFKGNYNQSPNKNEIQVLNNLLLNAVDEIQQLPRFTTSNLPQDLRIVFGFRAPRKTKESVNQGVAEGFNGEYDDEAGMAQGNLYTIAQAAQGLLDTIDDRDNLPEWAQEKIAKVEGMLVTVWNYLQSQKAQGIDPEIAEMYDAMDQLAEEMALKNRVSVDLVWESFEALDDHMLYETAAWRRKEGKSAKGGLNAKGVASYRRENPGSKLQTAVTTKPSKLKPGSKAAKRRKSFCARMSGVKGPAKKPNGKPTRKTLALRKWNC